MKSTEWLASYFALSNTQKINWRLSDEPIAADEAEQYLDPEVRKNTRATIFLGYTSNQVSCGNREVIRYLVQNKMVDLIVTTCGGIEEDFIKCMADTYIGDFAIKGTELRKKGNILSNLGLLFLRGT